MTARRIWLEHAALDDGVHDDVMLCIDDGSISSIEPGVVPTDDVERLPGLTLPGSANANSQRVHRGRRGRTYSGSGDFCGGREEIYEVACRLTHENYFDLARA